MFFESCRYSAKGNNCKANKCGSLFCASHWRQFFGSSAASSAYPAFEAALVSDVDCSDAVTVTKNAAGFFPFSKSGQRYLRGVIGFLEWRSFFHYCWKICRWVSKHYFIPKLFMSCSCVSSKVTQNSMVPIDVKNSCFTERTFPFGVVDRDTQHLFCSNSKLIWCHMKPKIWNWGNRKACWTDSERRRDSLS